MRSSTTHHPATDEYIVMLGIPKAEITLCPQDMAERVRQEIARRLADEVMKQVTLGVEGTA